ncbi:DUF5708 family protein [Amycolatopsis jejuensis]|uniref:DUF5708 family protein n=1 Tax=Amycolatopsis jejuensis TaxID=330084 RepID=UPI0005247312|nr:DUF5708 family protein [Amycolatopsis jejuensis]
MSANVKSLIIGVVMLVGGLILWQTGKGVEIPVFSLDKVGVVLAILGAIELVVTGAVMIFPSKNKKLDR